jgi:mono/diheme cytochrome c family protein
VSARHRAPVIAGAIVACAAWLVACPSKNEGASADAGADASANADATAHGGEGGALSAAAAAADGKEIVRGACLSCHTEHMLAQQRLTPAQWTKTVGKMTVWGANLDPKEVEPLVAYLSAMGGPDAGAYVAETVSAADAVAEVEPTPDAPIPTGDAERGKPLFINKCSGCHGAEAQGAIGVALVDKPFLYRAADFAKTIRRGRGKMIAQPLTDAEIGDLLAHLRSLRNPPLK